MDIEGKVKENFPDKMNCAQTVFKLVTEEKGIEVPMSSYLLAGLGGGIGLQGETCGAFTGGVAAIGAIIAQEIKDPLEHKKKAYQLAGKFISEMNEKFSTIKCSTLLGYDITDSNLREKNAKLFREVCPKFIEHAVKTILEMFPE